MMRCCADAGVQVLERVQSNAAASTSAKQQMIQPHRERITCDYTLLAACVHELRHRWLPAKVDQVSVHSRCHCPAVPFASICIRAGFPGEQGLLSVWMLCGAVRRHSFSSVCMPIHRYTRDSEAPSGFLQVIQADDDAVCLQLRFAVEEPAQAVISPSSDERRESVSAPAMYPWLAEQPGRQKGRCCPHLYRVNI